MKTERLEELQNQTNAIAESFYDYFFSEPYDPISVPLGARDLARWEYDIERLITEEIESREAKEKFTTGFMEFLEGKLEGLEIHEEEDDEAKPMKGFWEGSVNEEDDTEQ